MYGKGRFYPSFGSPKTNSGPYSSNLANQFCNTNAFDLKITEIIIPKELRH